MFKHFRPGSSQKNAKAKTARLMYNFRTQFRTGRKNLFSRHYRQTRIGGLTIRSGKLPKTLYSKKLSSPYDDDLRTDFKDMVELVADDDLLLAIDNGDKVDFWLQSSIAHFKNLLEERKISFYPTYAEANFEELRMISIPVYKKPDAKIKKKNKKQVNDDNLIINGKSPILSPVFDIFLLTYL